MNPAPYRDELEAQLAINQQLEARTQQLEARIHQLTTKREPMSNKKKILIAGVSVHCCLSVLLYIILAAWMAWTITPVNVPNTFNQEEFQSFHPYLMAIILCLNGTVAPFWILDLF